jgi:hypothetical protein
MAKIIFKFINYFSPNSRLVSSKYRGSIKNLEKGEFMTHELGVVIQDLPDKAQAEVFEIFESQCSEAYRAGQIRALDGILAFAKLSTRPDTVVYSEEVFKKMLEVIAKLERSE